MALSLFWCGIHPVQTFAQAVGQAYNFNQAPSQSLMAGQLQTQAPRTDSSGGFSMHGTVSARAVFYNASGIQARRQPFSYVLSGSLFPTIGDFSMPILFNLTEQDRATGQPMNIFSVNPTFGFVSLRGGYVNPTYNPYTIAGHQMLGGGIELSPGKFRIGGAFGQLLRAVPDDPNASFLLIPAYSRTGYAAHIGYGDNANFIELSFLKARDDSSSLATAPRYFDITPGDNVVGGLSGRVTLFNALSIYVNGAVSAFTRDVRARTVDGTTVSGAVLGGSVLTNLLLTNASTQLYTALDGGISLLLPNFSASVNYNRVDPDYRSMGVYFVNSDIQLVNASVNVSLLNQALRLTASFGAQNDNLQNKKLATTNRLLPSLMLSVAPSDAFGIDLSYTDMITTQTAGRAPLSDSTRMNMQNPLFSIAPRVTLRGDNLQHLITANGMYQQIIDNNRFTSDATQYNSLNAILGYNLTFLYDALTVGAGLNVGRLTGLGQTVSNNGVSINANKIFGGVFNLGGAVAFTQQQAGGVSANTLNGNLQASYRAGIHNVGLSVLYTGYSPVSTGTSFTELTGVLSYAVTF
jgi:hypothetical protein